MRTKSNLAAATALAVLVALALPASSAINFAYLTPGMASKPSGAIPKIALLTFDDGPDATTVKIARYLAGEKVPAAFFFIGKRVNANPSAVREIASLGFDICNHSMNHLDLARVDSKELAREIRSCSDAIAAAIGTKPLYFRPPYGAFSRRVVSAAEAQGLTTLLWTVDPFDWAEPGPAAVRDRVFSSVRPGAVILLHSNHEQTFQALPGIIDGLRQKGYRFVSAGEWFKSVLGVSAARSTPPKPEERPPARKQLAPSLPSLQPELQAIISPKVLKHASANGGQSIYTNIRDEDGLFTLFRAEGPLGAGAKPLRGLSWNEELPTRIVPQYRDDFLLNRRAFAKDYYPQPTFFMLTTLEDLPSMDQQFLRELVMQGGAAEMLILEPGSGVQYEIGDFGVPARYIPIAGFDATSVYDLSADGMRQLLGLYEAKKEVIFILLSAKDFASPEARANLENAAQMLLRFRQLTCERYYDPAADLRGDWLPESVSFARFSASGSPSLYCIAAQESQRITLPKQLQQMGIISLPVMGTASITRFSGRSINVSPDPLYLGSD